MNKQASSNGIGFLATLAINAAMGGMYYLWQFKGIEQAGNVFIFYVWAMAVLGSLLMFSPPSAKSYKPRPAILAAFGRTLTLLVLLATIWAGHIVAAVAFSVGWLITYVHFTKVKESAEATQ